MRGPGRLRIFDFAVGAVRARAHQRSIAARWRLNAQLALA
jgi:hypothetical protein